MAKLRVTFEVDSTQLFDRLRDVNGNTDMLGARLISAMLTGEVTSMTDIIGLSFYGVEFLRAEKLTPGETAT